MHDARLDVLQREQDDLRRRVQQLEAIVLGRRDPSYVDLISRPHPRSFEVKVEPPAAPAEDFHRDLSD